jgi:phage-related protein
MLEKEKSVIWLGSSLKDLKGQPENVQREIGYILNLVQQGKYHHKIQPLIGLKGVYEIRADFDSDTFRTVYAINIGNDIYVLHVFNKKSKQGFAVPKHIMEVIQARLKYAQNQKRKTN